MPSGQNRALAARVSPIGLCADGTRAAGQRRTARVRRPRPPRARPPAGVQHERLCAVARRVARRATRRGLRAQRRGPLVHQHAAQLLRAVAVARELLRLRVAARLRARGPPGLLPRSGDVCSAGAGVAVLAQRRSREGRCPMRTAQMCLLYPAGQGAGAPGPGAACVCIAPGLTPQRCWTT